MINNMETENRRADERTVSSAVIPIRERANIWF